MDDPTGLSLQWSVIGGLIVTPADMNPVRIRWTGSGDAIVRVFMTDIATGCTNDTLLHVTVASVPAPTIIASRPTEFCAGDSTSLDAGPGYASYQWSRDGAPIPSATFRRLVARSSGAYVVNVLDSAGCAASDTMLVTVRNPFILLASVRGSGRMCEGDSARLEAEAGFPSYQWRNEKDSVVGNGRVLVVRAPGRFTVSARDSLGCSGVSQPLDVRINPLPQPLIAGPRVICADGRDAYASASPTGRSWRWTVTGGSIDSGQGSGRILVRWGGTGQGTVELFETIDSSGCTGRSIAAIIIGTSLMPSIAGPAAICAGDTAWLESDAGYASYAWKNDSGLVVGYGPRLGIVASGTYTVTVADGGCTGASRAHAVLVHASPVVSIAGPVSFCEGDSIDLIAGAGFVSYAWRDSLGNAVGAGALLRVKAGGRYFVQATDTNGCRAFAAHTVAASPRPSPHILGSAAICEGDTAALATDRDYSTYAWRDANGNIIGTARRFLPSQSGSYTVEVTDGGGCAGVSAAHAISVLTRPSAAIAGPAAVCAGRTARYVVSSRAGESRTWTVLAGTLISGAASDTIDVRWDAVGIGTVLVEISNGVCVSTDTVRVTVGTSLSPRIAGPAALCAGDTAWLDAGAGYSSYDWHSPGGARSATQRIPVSGGGTYSVFVDDGNGCTGTAQHVLVVHPRPAPVIVGPQRICAGDTAWLEADPGFALYEWRDGGGSVVAASARVAVTVAGAYTVAVTDSNGCTGVSQPVVLIVNPLPPKPLIAKSYDTLLSTLAASYQWYRNDAELPGVTGQQLTAADTGWYRVRITDVNGCTNISDPVEVRGIMRITATVALPFVESEPGRRIGIPLSLVAEQGLRLSSVTSFTAVIRFDKNLLSPIDGTPTGSIDGAHRRITVARPFASGTSTLAELRFLTMLGPALSTPLEIESLAFNGAAVDVTAIAGEFRLLPCREGGARLFDGDATLFLGQNRPNPFNAQTEIEYGLIETGPVRLSVLDLLGREVAVLVDASMPPGRYRTLFDASRLSSGVYFTVLRTPNGSLVRAMQLAK
ncbi:MAG: T9SS type A sorting domain-containing protein [Ignavibacteria bacterium]|nr:T9SS type A sorting domain-containing protein [Ignavibacteria bacterium]